MSFLSFHNQDMFDLYHSISKKQFSIFRITTKNYFKKKPVEVSRFLFGDINVLLKKKLKLFKKKSKQYLKNLLFILFYFLKTVFKQ